jgi:hypothetical protein
VKYLPPDYNVPFFSKEGFMARFFHLWTKNVTDRQTLVGNGSPEGVVEALQDVIYIDRDATAGTGLYFKNLTEIDGDPKQGWKAVS